MSKFITLDKIVRDVCVALGDTDFSQYARVMRSTGLAVEDVFRNLIPAIKSELFEIKSNLTVQMPVDCTMITKVGVIDDAGRLLVLYEDTDIRRQLKNKQDEIDANCDTDSIVPEEITVEIPFYNCFFDTYCDVLYGYTYDPGVAGTYRYDPTAGIVEFGSGIYIAAGNNVVIEYKSNGAEMFQMIPAEAQSVIMARTHYNLNIGLRPQVAELQFQQFRREYAQLKRTYLRKNPEEYIRAFTRHYSPTPK